MNAAAVVGYDPLKDSRHREAVAARDLSDWLKWLEVGNKAARTLDSYERTAAVLLRTFPNKAFDEFTDGDLMHVLALFPPKSRHINKAALNSFFKFGYLMRRIPGNPMDRVPQIKYKPNRSYDIFSEAEAEALCSLPSPDGALCTLLLWAGLRRTEAIMLTGKRISFDPRQVIVIDGAKGDKQRRVPMIDRLAMAMSDLFTLEGIGPNDYLWSKTPGGGRVRRDSSISGTRFDAWWKDVRKAADVRYPASERDSRPHLCRHTFATRLRSLGLPPEEIQQVLGHESIRTTLDTYIHLDMADIAAHMREAVGDIG